ncbi:MAG: helix-turn-helix transcriptional regulator [Bradymonadales bacterium]|nr:helix-turn-helix transcriptional regulator [Bradymonadales bacterium]
MSHRHPDTPYTDFGKVAKGRRLELGLTQEQVADQVGVRPNYIGYLERGMRKPSDEICSRLANVLGLDRKELFFLANPQLKEILAPPAEPKTSAWETFSRDHQLHRRHGITATELELLQSLNRLGDIQDPRDYLFILSTIRQSLSRG